VFVAIAAAPLSSRAAYARVTAAAFAERLDTAERIARESETIPSPGRMDAVRAALGLPSIIVYDDEDPTLVAEDRFLDSLSGRGSGDFARAAMHIGVLESAFDLTRKATRIDRAAADAALARAYAGISANPGWIERVVRAIAAAFRWIFERLTSLGGVGSVASWLGVAALLALTIWGLARTFVPAKRIRSQPTPETPSIDWRARYADALAHGDEPEAVRAYYRLLLEALASRGIVPSSPSLTAGECRRSVGESRPRLYPSVAKATGVFERVAYGRRPLEPGDLEAMERAEVEVMGR